MKLAEMLSSVPNHAPDGKLSKLVRHISYLDDTHYALQAGAVSRILYLIAENGIPEDLQDIIDAQDKGE